ncbi:MAG: hypothetical protein QM747_03685 [Nocardioides sp.]
MPSTAGGVPVPQVETPRGGLLMALHLPDAGSKTAPPSTALGAGHEIGPSQ